MVTPPPAPWEGEFPPEEQHSIDATTLSRHVVQKKVSDEEIAATGKDLSYMEQEQPLVPLKDPVNPRNQWESERNAGLQYNPTNITKYR